VSRTSNALFIGGVSYAQRPRVAQYMPDWSRRKPVDNFYF
jgi:hypothetical protein